MGLGSVDALLGSAQTAGVDCVVLHAAATKAQQVQLTNDWVASVVRREERSLRVIGFGSVHIDFDDIPAEMNRVAKELSLSGLKLHPDFQGFDADDLRCNSIYESAVELGMVVMFHCGDKHLDSASPERIARVLRRFPTLRAIVAHMGGAFQWNSAAEHIAPIVAEHPDVYVDTSSSLWMMGRDEAIRMLRLFDVSKIFFGTDYPLRTHSEELAFLVPLLADAGLSQDDVDAVIGGNASRLLSLAETSAEADAKAGLTAVPPRCII